MIIRTLDIGADKQAAYLKLDKEENPALGYRAIRICLTRPEIFKSQLRAIYRASAFGNIAVMYPMITSVEEVKKVRRIAQEVERELTEQGLPHGKVEQGIMIETPAAAVISDLLAGEVDFFSIGTNDLTQYTLAMDRQNSRLDEFYNPHHEAVLRLIATVAENGHRGGCWGGHLRGTGSGHRTDRKISADGHRRAFRVPVHDSSRTETNSGKPWQGQIKIKIKTKKQDACVFRTAIV